MSFNNNNDHIFFLENVYEIIDDINNKIKKKENELLVILILHSILASLN